MVLGPAGAPLTNRLEQADPRGNRDIQTRYRARHREFDRKITEIPVNRRMPEPSEPSTIAQGPVKSRSYKDSEHRHLYR